MSLSLYKQSSARGWKAIDASQHSRVILEKRTHAFRQAWVNIN